MSIAIRFQFPKHRIIAAYEPGTATSCRAQIQKEMGEAFTEANIALITLPKRRKSIPKEELIDINKVSSDIHQYGSQVHIFENPDDIVEKSLSILQPGDVFIAMSNGFFGDVPRRILDGLSRSN